MNNLDGNKKKLANIGQLFKPSEREDYFLDKYSFTFSEGIISSLNT
jgi:hypothetical protein